MPEAAFYGALDWVFSERGARASLRPEKRERSAAEALRAECLSRKDLPFTNGFSALWRTKNARRTG